MSALATLHKAWRVFSPAERSAFLGLLPLMWLGMAMELATVSLFVPVMVAIVGSIAGEEGTRGRYAGGMGELLASWGVGPLLGLLLVAYLIKALFFSWLLYRQANFSHGLQASVSVRLYNYYLRMPYAFHLKHGTSELVRNMLQASQVFALGVVAPLLSLLTEIFVFIGLSALIVYVQPVAALVVGAMVVLLVMGVLAISRKRVGRWGHVRHLAEASRLSQARQGLANFREVLLAGRQGVFVESFEEPTRLSARASTLHSYLVELPRFWLEFLMVAGVVTLVGVLLLQGEDMASIIPVVGLVAAGAMRLVPSAGRLLTAFNTFRFGAAAVDDIYRNLREGESGAVPLAPSSAATIRAAGPLELRGVSFRYPGKQAGSLEGVNLTVRAGECLGIIGPSGGGKSTLLGVMLGLHPPEKGEVLWGGTPLGQCMGAWQAACGFVAQDLHLLDASMACNIALSPRNADIDRAALERAVDSAGLREWVNSLPEGLETPVGENGRQLSGGQRQRLGLARSLYRVPDYLFLDEPTSALDTDTESETMSALLALKGRLTLVIVAHRLSTVEGCDRVVVVDEGRVVDEGPAREILLRYRELDPKGGG